MKNNIKIFRGSLLLAILLTCSLSVFAEDAPPTLPGDPEGVPIDGGISLLVAAGVGYGAKKMKDKKAKIANADKG